MEFIKVRAKKSCAGIVKTGEIYYLKAGLVDLNFDGIFLMLRAEIFLNPKCEESLYCLYNNDHINEYFEVI